MFHDVTEGNNSVVEQDVNNNDVNITGFNAGTKWAPQPAWARPRQIKW
jgi:hypothetical protein